MKVMGWVDLPKWLITIKQVVVKVVVIAVIGWYDRWKCSGQRQLLRRQCITEIQDVWCANIKCCGRAKDHFHQFVTISNLSYRWLMANHYRRIPLIFPSASSSLQQLLQRQWTTTPTTTTITTITATSLIL